MSLSKRETSTRKIFDSRIVIFVVGRGESTREFRFHEGVLTYLSEPLRALLTGGIQESLEGKIIWDDVKPATFFLLWTTRIPAPTPFPIPRTKTMQKKTRKKNKTPKKKPRISEVSSTRKSPTPRKEESEDSDDEADSKRLVSFDHLMKPADLYILADKYIIEDLKKACIEDVCRKLYNATGHDESIAHTNFASYYLHYLIGDMKWAMSNDAVQNLIKEIPDFTVELLLGIPATYWKDLQRQP
ncbi:hypothetical protein CSAL01_10163 [Colletotrichum salicis]|uniref:BTB domain-containing protein n=1 Tax=Colletotrichum salicis TaxID=1209931 RepID=A0A135RNF6_9PEZI|nr:hypothetical protein CSAL01_10163 [Colletotrichum salicis]